jgi:hypothetical protein
MGNLQLVKGEAMSDLERRIEALEKVNRRWRYAAVSLAGVLLLAFVSAGKMPDDLPDLLQARRIQVVAPDGKPAVVLSATADGSSLTLSAQGRDHRRRIALAAHKEGVSLVLMKHAEAPLLRAEVDDDGSSLALFDGREPSQKPRGIVLRTRRPADGNPGATAIMLNKGMRKDELRAGLCIMEPTEKMDISYLFLGGPQGKTAMVKVNQQNGKVEVLDKSYKPIWSTP